MNIKIEFDALQVIDAIDRKGSFAAAAMELHRVPSAITYTVRKLETDLGVKLFDRRGYRAKLTQAGQTLLEQGRYLLQAAADMEALVKRVARGWEAELTLAVGDLIPIEWLFPVLKEFYAIACGTRIRLTTEVFGGLWDALATGRADLAIGAAGDALPGGGLATRPLGSAAFAFAVAPQHALASTAEPLSKADILPHRAVSAADSSRQFAPRTSGLLAGQDVLTVPDMRAKIETQKAALGAGFLPRHLIIEALDTGRLIEKQVEEQKADAALFLAWPSTKRGKALNWLVDRLAAELPRHLDLKGLLS